MKLTVGRMLRVVLFTVVSLAQRHAAPKLLLHWSCGRAGASMLRLSPPLVLQATALLQFAQHAAEFEYRTDSLPQHQRAAVGK